MNKEFLNQHTFTKQAILNNVLAPHNYNGVAAYDDLTALAREEKKRDFARKLADPMACGALFSVYNLTRFSQLSPSGRYGAIFGTFFFSFGVYAALSKASNSSS